MVKERGVSIPKECVSGDCKSDRGLKLWKYVSYADGRYYVHVRRSGEGPVPLRGPHSVGCDTGVVVREIIIGKICETNMDSFIVEKWRRHTAFHFSVGEATLIRIVRCSLVNSQPAASPASPADMYVPPLSSLHVTQVENQYLVKRGFGPLKGALIAAVQRLFARFQWIRPAGGTPTDTIDSRIIFRSATAYGLSQALWQAAQNYNSVWKLERVGATMDGLQMLEYHCSGGSRPDPNMRKRCGARIVAVEVAPDRWDVLTRHTGDVHNHGLQQVPIHPFLLANAVHSAGNGVRTLQIWNEASKAERDCQKLLDMPPQLTEKHENRYKEQHKIPSMSMHLYRACRERSLTPYAGKQEFKDHVKGPADRNADYERGKDWTPADIKLLNTTHERLHDNHGLLDAARPLVEYLRLPLVIGRVRTSLQDENIHRLRQVISRKELDGSLIEEKLQEELLAAAQEEGLVQYIAAQEGDCDWHAFLMTTEQRQWLDSHPRLGYTIQADYTFHVFGKKHPIMVGALVDVHQVAIRSLPLAFFLYKDTGEAIRRRTLEWSLRELQKVMDTATPRRCIEHVVVDWEGAHLSAGLDFITKGMEEALTRVLRALMDISGEGAGELGPEVSTEAIPRSALEDEHDINNNSCTRNRRREARAMLRNQLAAAKKWLDTCERQTRLVVVPTAAKWAAERRFQTQADIDEFASGFKFNESSVEERPSDVPVEDLVLLAQKDFKSLSDKLAKAWEKAQSRPHKLMKYSSMVQIYADWKRCCNRHRHILSFIEMPHLPLLHGCLVHFKRSIRHKVRKYTNALVTEVMGLVGDATFLQSPREMAQSLGTLFQKLQAQHTAGATKLINYLTRTWMTRSWRHFMWDPELFTTNNVEAVWKMTKDLLPAGLPPHQILGVFLPSRAEELGNVVRRCGREGLDRAPRRPRTRAGITLASDLRRQARDGTLAGVLQGEVDSFLIRGSTADINFNSGTQEHPEHWDRVSLEAQTCSCRMFERSAARHGEHLIPMCTHLEALLELRRDNRIWLEILAALAPLETPAVTRDNDSSVPPHSDDASESSGADDMSDVEAGDNTEGVPPDTDGTAEGPRADLQHSIEPTPAPVDIHPTGVARRGAGVEEPSCASVTNTSSGSSAETDDESVGVANEAASTSVLTARDVEAEVYLPLVDPSCGSVPPMRRDVEERLFRGMINQGDDCFLIALLQALLHSPLFVEVLHNHRNTQDTECIRIMKELAARRASEQRTVTDLRNQLPPALHAGHQDAGEALDFIKKDLCLESGTEDTYLIDIPPALCIWTRTVRACIRGHSTSQVENHDILHMPIHGRTNWISVLGHFAHEERPAPSEESEKSDCGPCGRQMEKSIQIQFQTLPPILIIQLVRFEHRVTADGVPRSLKIQTPVDMPLRLTFEGHPGIWLLRSAVLHHGTTLERGHYTAVVRSQGSWWCFNDGSRRKIRSQKQVLQKVRTHGYIFFYEHDPSATLDELPAPRRAPAVTRVTRPKRRAPEGSTDSGISRKRRRRLP